MPTLRKKIQINNLIFHIRHWKIIGTKVIRRREIIKVRAEINEVENRICLLMSPKEQQPSLSSKVNCIIWRPLLMNSTVCFALLVFGVHPITPYGVIQLHFRQNFYLKKWHHYLCMRASHMMKKFHQSLSIVSLQFTSLRANQVISPDQSCMYTLHV